MHGLSYLLVAVSVMGRADSDMPRKFEIVDPNFVLATFGLQPYSAETSFLSLEDYWKRIHPLKPDLVITKVVLVPSQPRVGDFIQATIYYKNIGGKEARHFYLRLTPGPFDQGGFGLGGDFAHLRPGEEKKYLWGALRATKAGLYKLHFSVDPNGEVDESNRRNNGFAVTIRVEPEK